jgi:hypothetical protein
MTADMEALIVQFGAAIVVRGHMHAYERSLPVTFGKPDKRGPTVSPLGDFRKEWPRDARLRPSCEVGCVAAEGAV